MTNAGEESPCLDNANLPTTNTDDAGAPSRKEALRKTLRERRCAVDDDARESASEAAARHAMTFFSDAPLSAVIGGYWPMRGEIDPRPLMRALARRGHTLSLPAVDVKKTSLVFRSWSFGDTLERGEHATVHPAQTARTVSPDYVIVPLVGFDVTGARLGQGGGYYDRTLRALRPRALGLAFECQQCAALPVGFFDEALDAVATEANLYRFATARRSGEPKSD